MHVTVAYALPRPVLCYLSEFGSHSDCSEQYRVDTPGGMQMPSVVRCIGSLQSCNSRSRCLWAPAADGGGIVRASSLARAGGGENVGEGGCPLPILHVECAVAALAAHACHVTPCPAPAAAGVPVPQGAAAAPPLQRLTDAERLMTAAAILAQRHAVQYHDHDADDSPAAAASDHHVDSPAPAAAALVEPERPRRLSADQLAVALGAIRAARDEGEDTLLTDRLLTLLRLTDRRGGGGGGGGGFDGAAGGEGSVSSACASAGLGAAARAGSPWPGGVTASMEEFWDEPDEWRDVRAVLLRSVDDVGEEEEEAGAAEGVVMQRAAAVLADVLQQLREGRSAQGAGSGGSGETGGGGSG